MIGDLDALDEPSFDAPCCPPATATAARTPPQVLEAMRSAAPDDPFWKGVAATEVVDDGVEVEFNHGAEPRRLEVDGVEVECHLHDPEALEAAKRAAREGRPDQRLKYGD